MVLQPGSNFVRARSQCLHENFWTTAGFRTAPSGTSSQLIETSSCSPSSAGPRRWHSRDVWSLDTLRLGQKVSKEPCLLCRYRCRLLLAEIPKGVDWNSELKQRLQLWESGQVSVLIGKVLGQQNSGSLRRIARRVQPQTDEQRGNRAFA